MKPTIKDVAREAHCGICTVSNIINRNNLKRYSDETIKRVRDIAKQLGYRPNRSASSLRSGKTNVIGITHGLMVGMDRILMNPYLGNVYAGIGSGLARYSRDLLIHNVYKVSDGTDPDIIGSLQIDGLIYIHFVSLHHIFIQQHVPVLKHAGFPVVIVHSTDMRFPFPSIGFDIRAGGAKGTRHLLEHGYGSIGFAGYRHNHRFDNLLYAGYADALKRAGQKANADLRFEAETNTVTGGRRLAERMVASGRKLPRALFVSEDAIAHGVISGLKAAGISVPEDMALVGFGDYYSDEALVHSLTSVVQPAFEKGKRACEWLNKRLKDGKSGVPEQLILMPSLNIRHSCGC